MKELIAEHKAVGRFLTAWDAFYFATGNTRWEDAWKAREAMRRAHEKARKAVKAK